MASKVSHSPTRTTSRISTAGGRRIRAPSTTAGSCSSPDSSSPRTAGTAPRCSRRMGAEPPARSSERGPQAGPELGAFDLVHSYRELGPPGRRPQPARTTTRRASAPRAVGVRLRRRRPRSRRRLRAASGASAPRRCASSSRACRRPTAARSASSTCTSPTRTQRRLAPGAHGADAQPARCSADEDRAAHPRPARRGGGLRAVPAHEYPSARSASRSKAASRSSRCSTR